MRCSSESNQTLSPFYTAKHRSNFEKSSYVETVFLQENYLLMVFLSSSLRISVVCEITDKEIISGEAAVLFSEYHIHVICVCCQFTKLTHHFSWYIHCCRVPQVRST